MEEIIKNTTLEELEKILKSKEDFQNEILSDGRCALMIACQFGYLKKVEKLLEYGANINYQIDDEYFEIESEYNQYTPLLFAIVNNHADIVIRLICDANFNKESLIEENSFEHNLIYFALSCKNEETIDFLFTMNLFRYISRDETSEIVQLIYKQGNEDLLGLCKNDRNFRKYMTLFAQSNEDTNLGKEFAEPKLFRENPEQLSKILKKFSNDERLRFTNHPWTNDVKYDEFYKNLDSGWEEIKDDLKKLSPKLHTKINSILFEKAENIGFSSINIRAELEKGVSPSSIAKISESMDNLKQSIVIKSDENYTLIDMFGRVLEKIDLELNINLENIESFSTKLFTDVEKLENALDIILKDIHKKQSDAEIKVTIEDNSDNEQLINLKIIHMYQKDKERPKPKSKELLDTIGETGDFTSIYDNLKSICYWDVEAECEDGKKRIEYLYPSKNNDKPHLISIPDKIEGFTHILRLYK